MKPSSTSRSINAACSSQNGCSRTPFVGSRLGPTDEIATNKFFITSKSEGSCAVLVDQTIDVMAVGFGERRAVEEKNGLGVELGAAGKVIGTGDDGIVA